MQHVVGVWAFAQLLLCLGLLSGSEAVRLVESPVTKVVTLLQELETKIKSDGTAEQTSYNKFADWCEDTLDEKSKAITKAKETIETEQQEIYKLKGDLASHTAEIAQLKKDIAANKEAQKDLIAVREKEHETYLEEKLEFEQSLAALGKAIEVLAAGSKPSKKAFLENIQEARILSVVAGVRDVLKTSAAAGSVPAKELEVVKSFVSKPEDFIESERPLLSAAQIAQNPFGNYAPQSFKIQGILKSMKDSFTADLNEANTEESEKKTAFDALIKTKGEELSTFESTLQSEETSQATKTKDAADSKTTRDNAKEQLDADKEFFQATKSECELKARQWAKRSELRKQELAGVAEAIKILSSDDAKATFKGAHEGTEPESFLQLSNVERNNLAEASTHLQSLAMRYHSFALFEAAADAKAGHFDKVIAAIDSMMAELREEEQDDIDHRDRCEGKQDKNKNTLADLDHAITMANTTISRLTEAKAEKTKEIEELEALINATIKSMEDRTDLREKEKAAFVKSVTDDRDAVKLIEDAIVALSKFLDNTKAALVQKGHADPKPEMNWQDGNYAGRREEGHGIIEALSMIKEDLEKEIKVGRHEDTDSQVEYEKAQALETKSMYATKKAKSEAEAEEAALQQKIVDMETEKGMREDEKVEEEAESTAIKSDCEWVKEHFTKRRDKRKIEMDSLVSAKAYLSGTEDDLVSA